MSHIWTFSPASRPLLHRCLEAAVYCESSNPWTQLFGAKNEDLLVNNKTIIVLNDSPDIENMSPTEIKEENVNLCSIEDIFDIDADVISKFDIVVEMSLKNPKLLTKMAQTLPISTTEGLFQIIFDDTSKDNEFLLIFFKFFLPVFIKHDNSRFCTEILQQTYKLYPGHFRNMLPILIRDVDVQNNVLLDFIITLNETTQAEFLNIYMLMELNCEEFLHNIFIIYTVYKTCKKSVDVQKYIYSCLKKYSEICVNDKNYGRLFLCFLQNETNFKCISYTVILEVLEIHRSPFKRPCMAILNE